MSWSPSAYISPGNVIVSGTFFPIVSALILVGRFKLRREQRDGLGLDDWLILAATIVLTGMGAELVYGVAVEVLAKDTPEAALLTQGTATPAPQLVASAKIGYSFQLLMIVCFGLTKLSAVLFCRRIFVVEQHSRFDLVSQVALTLLLAWTVGFFLAFVFQCGTAFQAIWAPKSVPTAYCYSNHVSGVALAISELLTNLLIFGLPIPSICKLKISFGRRLAVLGIFLLGAMSIAASITRVVIHAELLPQRHTPSVDQLQLETIVLYWSMIEAGLAVLATNLPSIWQLFRSFHLPPKLFRRQSNHDRYHSSECDRYRKYGPISRPIPLILPSFTSSGTTLGAGLLYYDHKLERLTDTHSARSAHSYGRKEKNRSSRVSEKRLNQMQQQSPLSSAQTYGSRLSSIGANHSARHFPSWSNAQRMADEVTIAGTSATVCSSMCTPPPPTSPPLGPENSMTTTIRGGHGNLNDNNVSSASHERLEPYVIRIKQDIYQTQSMPLNRERSPCRRASKDPLPF